MSRGWSLAPIYWGSSFVVLGIGRDTLPVTRFLFSEVGYGEGGFFLSVSYLLSYR